MLVVIMLRCLHIVMACWSLVALPALCAAGMVGHPCEVRTERDCADHEGASGENGHCEHESSCPEDPCNLIAVQRAEGEDEVVSAPALALTGPAGAAVVAQAAEAAPYAGPPGQDWLTPYLPFPRSDIPLRI